MTTLTTTRSLFAACLAALSGCGGGASSAPAPAPVVIDDSGVRGSLIRNPPEQVLSLDPAGVQSRARLFGSYGIRLNAIAGAARYGVDVHRFEYATVGAAGEKTTASGALMVPRGGDAACTGPRPIVIYAHGSSQVKSVNLADVEPGVPYGITSMTFEPQGLRAFGVNGY